MGSKFTSLFQSAVAHELISNSESPGRHRAGGRRFQSAVAHELISNTRPAMLMKSPH